MATRITVLIKDHPNGGIPVIGYKSKEEYREAYLSAREAKSDTLTIQDSDGDYAVFVLSEVQGMYIETID